MHKNTNFINIGERTNITGSLLFKKLILDNKFDSAVSVAKDQIENGAQIIDINMDEGLLDSKKCDGELSKFNFIRAGYSKSSLRSTLQNGT